MSFFGRPVSSVFNGNVAMAAIEGTVGGLVAGYIEGRAAKSEHPFRQAITTGAAWGATDLAVEVGLNVVAPGIRAGGGMQSALVSAALGGVTGVAEGYIEGKARHEDNPWKRAAATGSAWAVLDGGWEFAATPIRRYANSKFPH
jgi:hypothetical protein